MNDPVRSDRLFNILNIVQLVIAGIIVMVPTLWMVLSSFKQSYQVTAYPPTIFFSPTLSNYAQLSQTTSFLHYGVNSIIVTVTSTAIGILLGTPAAFAVSWTRVTWPAVVALVARMAPGMLFLLPWYIMFRHFGMVGSYWSLILTHAVITMPIVLWVMLPFFDNIPHSVFEAAQIDGCGPIKIFRRIALPPLILAMVVQRWLVSGLTLGAVKG